MIYEEMKRRLLRKNVLISVLGISLVTMIFIYIPLGGLTGLRERIRSERKMSGDITQEKMVASLREAKDMDFIEGEENIFILGFMKGMVEIYPGILYGVTDIKNYPYEYASEYYRCWKDKSREIIRIYNSGNSQMALEELDKVEFPFKKYGGYDIWSVSMDSMKYIYFIILIMVAFFSARTYSESFEDGSMEIINASKLGRRNKIVRMIPPIVYGIVMVSVVTCIMIISMWYIVGLDGMRSSFKIHSLFSVGNNTIGGALGIMYVSEVLGVLAVSTLMSWVSYIVKVTSTSVSIGVGIVISYLVFCRFIVIPGEWGRVLSCLLPGASAWVLDDMSGYNFIMSCWKPYAVMLCMSGVFWIFGIWIAAHALFRGKEIKKRILP